MTTASAIGIRNNLSRIEPHHIVEARSVAKADYPEFRTDVSSWAKERFPLLWNKLASFQQQLFEGELKNGIPKEGTTKHIAAEQGAMVGLHIVRRLIDEDVFSLEEVQRNHRAHLTVGELAEGAESDEDLELIFSHDTLEALQGIPDMLARGACAGVLFISSTNYQLDMYLREARAQQLAS